MPRWPTEYQRSCRYRPSVMGQNQLTRFFGWIRGDQDDCFQRCPAGGPHGTGRLCLELRTRIKRFRDLFEGEGAQAFACMDEVSIGVSGVQASTVRAFAILRTVDNISIMVNPAKAVALPPDGHIPTMGYVPLLESVHVRVANEAGVTVVGVPIGTDERVLERAMEVVKDRGVDRLECCLIYMPDKQAASFNPRSEDKLARKGLDTRLSL